VVEEREADSTGGLDILNKQGKEAGGPKKNSVKGRNISILKTGTIHNAPHTNQKKEIRL